MILLVSGPWAYPNREHLFGVLDGVRPSGIIAVRHECPRDILRWYAARHGDEWWVCRLRVVDTPFLAFGTITPQFESTACNLPDAVLAFPADHRQGEPMYAGDGAHDARRLTIALAQRYGVPVMYAGAGERSTGQPRRSGWPHRHRARRRTRAGLGYQLGQDSAAQTVRGLSASAAGRDGKA